MYSTVAVLLFIFLLSVVILLYDRLVKGIPTRLDPGQAPKSRYGFVQVAADGSPARADGIE